MLREKSPGLKILWIWTFGTAAILVTSVVRTRLRDMENLMNNAQEEQQQQQISSTDSIMADSLPKADELLGEDKS